MFEQYVVDQTYKHLTISSSVFLENDLEFLLQYVRLNTCVNFRQIEQVNTELVDSLILPISWIYVSKISILTIIMSDWLFNVKFLAATVVVFILHLVMMYYVSSGRMKIILNQCIILEY